MAYSATGIEITNNIGTPGLKTMIMGRENNFVKSEDSSARLVLAYLDAPPLAAGVRK